MFVCVFDGDFGMGRSLNQAFEDMLGSRGETTGETQAELDMIPPDGCFFFQEVDISAKPGGWDIQIK